MVREDANDLIFLSMEEKFEAILNDIIEICDKGAPVLVGTASIDTSEILSNYLSKKKISHEGASCSSKATLGKCKIQILRRP